jgi:endonuclease G, mitochondrial
MMPSERANRARSFLAKITPRRALEGLETPQDLAESLLPERPLPPEHAGVTESSAMKFATGAELSPSEQFALEAIIIPDKRPAIDIIDGDYTIVHKEWLHFNTDADIKRNIRKAIPSIGRIELPHHPTLPYAGTGSVVGDHILMTNRHVAEIFCSGLGIRNLIFRPGYEAGIDFLQERDKPASLFLEVRRVLMVHPFWDMALLHVDGLAPAQAPLTLSLQRPEDMNGRDVAIIGYPAFDRRNDPKIQDQVFGGVYYVKRLQPGKLRERRDVESFGKKGSGRHARRFDARRQLGVGCHRSSDGSRDRPPFRRRLSGREFRGAHLRTCARQTGGRCRLELCAGSAAEAKRMGRLVASHRGNGAG